MSSHVRSVSAILLFCMGLPLVGAACATGNVAVDDDGGTLPEPEIDGATPVLPEEDGGGTKTDASKKDGQAGDSATGAPAPKLTSLAPAKSPISTAPVTVTITGTDFDTTSVVEVDGTAIATTYASATQLQATIPAAMLSAVKNLAVVVNTPAPGGGSSAPLTFAVENPAPTATSLSPLGAVVGAPATLLTVTGTGFVTGTKIVFAGSDLVTTVKSPTSVEATIPAAQLATAGTFNVFVVNPTPGGGTTTALSFTVSTPAVQLSTVTPASAIVGSGATSVQLVGTGFLPTTQVLFNGVAITASYVDSTRMNATIPAASLMTVGDLPITARNPPPGGGTSNPVSFRVQYAAPTLASIAPSTANAGSGPTQVVLTGTGFYAASQVTFDGVAATTTYVSATEVRATLTAAQLANGGVIAVRVSTPAPGGGLTGTQSFTVQNPAPSVTGINPTSVVAGAGNTTITVTGSGFVPLSAVRANGTPITTTFVSGTTLTAIVPSSYFVNPGNVSITVANPNPGGGTSGAFNLAVGCNSTGVDVTLGAINNTTTLSTTFGAAPAYNRYSSAGTCPTTLNTTTQPVRSWVVQNTAGVPIVLSAWAVCTSDAAAGRQDDGFLAFYRRSTVPTADADRRACTGFVSEGTSGSNGYTSPEAGGSSWCPGLTKGNGAGITLGVCERIVVQAQPWSNTSTSYTPFATVRLRPEAP